MHPVSESAAGAACAGGGHDATFAVSQAPKSVEKNVGIHRFLAIGDFGDDHPTVRKNADAMSRYVSQTGPIAFVAGLGDNFYPNGVRSVDDPRFTFEWSDMFLARHENLRVPWKMVLGNHDYEGNWRAQVDFTHHTEKNPYGGVWQMPDRNYRFTVGEAEFFVLDTNGAQAYLRAKYPNLREELTENIAWLKTQLLSSTARWKIVLAHHPLYTCGLNHSIIGRCIRDHEYTSPYLPDTMLEGYGLEDVLVECGLDAYISGHEHVFQHHFARGIHHFVAGAGGPDPMFYGGPDDSIKLDWVDQGFHTGFLAAQVSHDVLEISFVSVDGKILHTARIEKKSP